MKYHLRVARPVSDLSRAVSMYCKALDLRVLDRFEDHDGFDGVMLGREGMQYHFEFTYRRFDHIVSTPTSEDLVVFYIEKHVEWKRVCSNMLSAGFEPVSSRNPYWDVQGKSFADFDGYRVVLQNSSWINR